MIDIPAPNLLYEMLWVAKKQKAEMVLRKCVRAGKLKWAMKIAFKYGLQLENNNDTVMACAMALWASNEKNNHT